MSEEKRKILAATVTDEKGEVKGLAFELHPDEENYNIICTLALFRSIVQEVYGLKWRVDIREREESQ